MPILTDSGGSDASVIFGIIGISAPPPTSPSAPPTIGTAPTISTTPTPGQGIAVDINGKLPTSVVTAGSELVALDVTGSVTVTGTELAPTDVAAMPTALVFDGSPIKIEWSFEAVESAAVAGAFVMLNLWDGSTDLGRVGLFRTPSAATTSWPASGFVRYVPTSGLHTFKLRAWQSGGNGTIYADTGGAGIVRPGSFRVTRV